MFFFTNSKINPILEINRKNDNRRGSPPQPIGIHDTPRVKNPETTKPKKDMARILKVKGIEKWRLLFARKDIEPVPFKYIMPKNVVNMIRTAPGAFLPCLPQKKFVMGNHTIDYYTPLNTDIKFWEQMELKQAALETMTPGEAKKMMIIAGVVIVGMLIFTGLMIYFNLQAAQKSVAHIDILANAVSNLAKGVPA